MKKSLFLCGALFALTAFVGCSDDDDPKVEAPTLKLSTNVVTVSADGTGAVVEVTTNQTSWKASRPEADVWCVLKQGDNKLSVSATANETLTARTTKLTVIAGTGSDAKTEEITVTQSAANAYLTVEGLEADVPVRLDAAGTVIEFTINTNAATWSATRPETDIWCTLTQDGNKLKIQAEAYTEDAERTTKITISGGAEPVSFDVVQKGEIPVPIVYAINIPTDFSESYVQKVMIDGVKVAEICLEYLCNKASDMPVDAQMKVIYPVVNDKTDLTNGLVINNGGKVVWDTENNTCTYTAGTNTEPLTTVYLFEGNISSETTSTNLKEVVVEPELLIDIRPGDKCEYKITKIGTQYWMAENLRARVYVDGTTIPDLSRDNSTWSATTEGAFRMTSTETFIGGYGACYNGYAMYNTKQLAPVGWIVPSDTEWKKLYTYVGRFGAKLRMANGGWLGGTNCTNLTGFSLIPTGSFIVDVGDSQEGSVTKLWNTTIKVDYNFDVVPLEKVELPTIVLIGTGETSFTTVGQAYASGNYIRCVKK